MTMKGVCSVSAEQDSDIRYDTPPELNRQVANTHAETFSTPPSFRQLHFGITL